MIATVTPNLKSDSCHMARRLLRGASLAALTALAAGCTAVGTTDVDPFDYDQRVRHPIMISNAPETLDMTVGMNGPALSRQIERKIQAYVAEYQADGTGSVTIQVPIGSANEIAAAESGRAIHYALVRAGVPRAKIQVAPYQVGDLSKVSPLRLSYLRVKAVTPRCGIWPDDGVSGNRNTQYYNYGCAQQQNLAAMVADPSDFVRPKTMTPANGDRRANVIKLFVDLGNTGWVPEPEKKLLPAGGTGAF